MPPSVELNLPVTLSTPHGGSIHAHVRTLAVERAAATAPDVRLVLDLDPSAWAEVDADNHFHLQPAYRGAVAGGGLSADAEVRLEAALDCALAAERFGPIIEVDPVAAALRSPTPGDPLLETDSWLALTVTQEAELPVGAPPGSALREGFRTHWAEALDEGRFLSERADGEWHPVLDALRALLEEQRFPSERIAGSTALRLEADGEQGLQVLWLVTDEDEMLVSLQAALPLEIPVERRSALLDLVARINVATLVGNLQLSPDEGPIAFKVGADLADQAPTAGILEGMLRQAVLTMDHCRPAIEAVLDGADVDEALDLIA